MSYSGHPPHAPRGSRTGRTLSQHKEHNRMPETIRTIRIKYNRADIRGLGPDVRLLPTAACPDGVNHVPAEVWAEFEQHPQIAPLVEEGVIEVLDTPSGKAGKRGRRGKAAEGVAPTRLDSDPEDDVSHEEIARRASGGKAAESLDPDDLLP